MRTRQVPGRELAVGDSLVPFGSRAYRIAEIVPASEATQAVIPGALRAIATAIDASVTVSMSAEIIGIDNSSRGEMRVARLVERGSTSL